MQGRVLPVHVMARSRADGPPVLVQEDDEVVRVSVREPVGKARGRDEGRCSGGGCTGGEVEHGFHGVLLVTLEPYC